MAAVPGVLEREAELERLRGAVDAAALRDGSVVLVEGPAGIGKTALLRGARDAADASGLTVLHAIASELDRDFAFGVVHQLLDPVLAGADAERRERLLTGAARRAESVLEPSATGDATDGDPGYAVLHGLYWLIANLAEEAPVALLVDDLHWADRPSLRLLEYLGRRLEGVPVLVAATLRPNEPGADAELLTALGTSPAAEHVRPDALSEAAAAELIAGALGSNPDPAFVAAVAEATGGNPLLLLALAREAAEHGLKGGAGEARRVAELGAVGLGAVVQRRLRALGPDAVGFARAAAVLGGRRGLDDLRAVAGLDATAAATAADLLVAAELLEPSGWDFVHPVVRAAVHEGTPPAERAGLHERAAQRLLLDPATRPEEVAVHLLNTEPAGDQDVVAALAGAARLAAAEGAPETAVTYLRRALAEPPAETAARAGLRLELGELELRIVDPAAYGDLTAALDDGLAGDDAARARAARGTLTLQSDAISALTEFERALGEAEDPELRLRLESLLLEATVYHADLVPRRRELLDAGRAADDPSPVMLAHLAVEAGYSGAPADETIALAERAAAGGELLRVIGPENSTYNLLIHGVRYAEGRDPAATLLEAGDAAVRRAGVEFASLFLAHAHAYWHLMFGSVGTGLGHAQSGLDKALAAGYAVPAHAFRAIVAELLVEYDRLDDAVAVVDAIGEEVEETVAGPFALGARGLVRWRSRRRDDAIADLRRAIAVLDARGWHSPVVSGARPWLALVLAEAGERDEALDIAEAQVATARAAGLPGSLGAALRVHGRALGGDEGIEVLETAVEAFDGAELPLLHGWTLHDLGAAIRRTGRRADAREPLRIALDIATRAEAPLLAGAAREELAAAGGRPAREALSGPASLTPSERRVADLAAQGLSNREIAETLWVTRKTVELHLGHTYGKLGIRSRKELPTALAPEAA